MSFFRVLLALLISGGIAYSLYIAVGGRGADPVLDALRTNIVDPVRARLDPDSADTAVVEAEPASVADRSEDAVETVVVETETETVTGEATGTAASVEEEIETATTETVEAVEDGTDAAAESVEEAAADTAVAIEDGADAATDEAAEAVEAAGEETLSFAERTEESIANAAQAVANVTGQAVETVGETAGAVGESVGETAAAARDSVGETVDALGETMGDAAGAVGEAASAAGDAVTSTVSDAATAVGGAVAGLTGSDEPDAETENGLPRIATQPAPSDSVLPDEGQPPAALEAQDALPAARIEESGGGASGSTEALDVVAGGMAYDEARATLIEAGWTPRVPALRAEVPDEAEAALIEAGYTELKGCEAGERPICRFEFVDGERRIAAVLTRGTGTDPSVVDAFLMDIRAE